MSLRLILDESFNSYLPETNRKSLSILFSLEIKDVVFEDYENSLITTIYYKDEEIYCDADTTGKSFDSYLDKRENF